MLKKKKKMLIFSPIIALFAASTKKYQIVEFSRDFTS